MDVDEDIRQISDSLGELQSELAKATPTTANPELRQFLESMAETLQTGRAQFAEVYKSASAKADARLAGVRAQSKSVKEKVCALEKKLALPPVPKMPAVPVKSPFVVDQKLGQRLRQELLDRFAPDRSADDQLAWSASREAWDDWTDWSQT